MSARAEAAATQRWRDLCAKHTAEANLNSVHFAPKLKSKQNPKGAGRKAKPGSLCHTAKALGISHVEVQRREKIAKMDPAAADILEAAGLDSQTDLLVVAQEPKAKDDPKPNPISTAWVKATYALRSGTTLDAGVAFASDSTCSAHALKAARRSSKYSPLS